jgi:hypothetical protein
MPELIPIEPCMAIGLVIATTVTAGLDPDPSYLRFTVTSSLPVTETPVIWTLSAVLMPLALNIDLWLPCQGMPVDCVAIISEPIVPLVIP